MFPMTPLQSWATMLLLVILVLSLTYLIMRANSKLDQMQEQRRKNAAIRARNAAIREARRG